MNNTLMPEQSWIQGQTKTKFDIQPQNKAVKAAVPDGDISLKQYIAISAVIIIITIIVLIGILYFIYLEYEPPIYLVDLFYSVGLSFVPVLTISHSLLREVHRIYDPRIPKKPPIMNRIITVMVILAITILVFFAFSEFINSTK